MKKARARDPRLLATDEAMAGAIAKLDATVGVDTEFMRVRTFHPIPALYQLADDDTVLLLDGQANASFAALKALLTDPDRCKVMHACSEDLEVMAVHLGLRPVVVADTQLAHAFLTPAYSAGYASVVEHYLGRALEQHESRSDWLKRPLSNAQIRYAREDAAYLVPVYEKQRAKLKQAGRLDWFEAEMARLLSIPEETPETWFRTVKSAWRLSPQQLAVLRSLTRWREREARRRNLPRNWVVPDTCLMTLARRDQIGQDEVLDVLPAGAGRRFVKPLCRAHREGMADPSPPSPVTRPLSPADGTILDQLRQVVRSVADGLGLAAEVLGRKRELDALCCHWRDVGELPDWFGDWRLELLGETFERRLRSWR